MVKTPRTRHSKTGREPVTIELGPDAVSRVVGTRSPATQPDQPFDVVEEAVATAESSEGSAMQDVAASAASETASESEATLRNEAEATERPARSEPPRAQPSRAEPPSASAPPSRPSRGSALTAGLAGGIVALVAGGLLQYSGLLGAPNAGSSAPALPASVETDIASLKSEIESLKAAGDQAGGQAVDISGVTGQVDALSQALDQVKTDMASLKQAVESGGAGDGAGLEALNARIAGIESRIAAIGPGTDPAMPETIASINERIAGIEALAKASTDAGSVVDGRLGALEQGVSSLTAKVEAQADQPKIALAIAASALKAAIERGAAFQPEIETFAAIAPEAPGLAELKAYAEKGVTTRADILAETDAAAKAMIAAANPPPANAGFFDRLLSSAESMVSVRPIGAVEGPGVPETVARMEVALQAGDFAKALAEFDTLPDTAKAAGAAFADKVKARLTAEQLADQAIAAAMQAA
ncbi:MAG: phage tail protein [Hyphomicrobiales bacterium]|nr:phage tail protein [Hyphomicrobiales bacterium]